MSWVNSRKLLGVAIVVALSAGMVQAETIDKTEIYKLRPTAKASLTDLVYDPPITWPTRVGVQQTGVINASFNDRGTFGRGYLYSPIDPAWPQVFFESPPGSQHEYLFGAALWVGGIVGNDTLVSIGHSGWMFDSDELTPQFGMAVPGVTKLDGFSDFSMRAGFVDTGMIDVSLTHTPLNIRLANRTHVWRSSPYDNSIVYDLVITNIGDQLIESGYLAILVDADAFDIPAQDGWEDDLAGSIREEGIGYVIDNDGEPNGSLFDQTSLTKAFALKFLGTSFVATDTNFTWLVHNGNSALDFSPRQKADSTEFCNGAIGTPECDADFYHIMSYPEWDYDAIYTAAIDTSDTIWRYPEYRGIVADLSEGWDMSIIMSIGPFDLPPDSSVRIQYTMFTADSIHTAPDNWADNLSQGYNPDQYLANLDIDRLIPNAAAAAEKAATLFDPLLPPTGLALLGQTETTATFEWDPWVLDNIEGYDIFLTPYESLDIPHPGLIPPWLGSEKAQLHASVGRAYQYEFIDISPEQPYVVHVANRTGAETGALSQPAVLNSHGGQMPAPVMAREIMFVNDAGSVVIEFSGANYTSHYNLYKFATAADANLAYEPFYDLTRRDNPEPADSVAVADKLYYYYAMEPFAVIDGDKTFTITESLDGEVFILTAVDSLGFKSDLSARVSVIGFGLRNKDVLVITGGLSEWTPIDSIISFYDRILSIMGLEYTILNLQDCDGTLGDCLNMSLLGPHKLVIVDDGVNERLTNWNATLSTLATYVMSGGRLATFNYQPIVTPMFHAEWSLPRWPLALSYTDQHYIDIDSAMVVILDYYFFHGGLPDHDTLFGLNLAASETADLPTLQYDPRSHQRGETWSGNRWPFDGAPSPTVFAPGPNSEVTHLFESSYPETSLMHDFPVGIKTIIDNEYGHHEVFTFGFHLHLMYQTSAQNLIVGLLRTESCCGRYVSGRTGNVNCDTKGSRNLADIVRLIDRLWLSKTPLCCESNGNVDGDSLDKLNIADVTRLIDHVYLTKTETASCE